MLEKDKSKNFEIVLQVRNLNGEPTGRTKSFSSDSPEEIEGWFNSNTWRDMRPRPKNKNKVANVTSGKEGTAILKEMLIAQENTQTQ